MAVLAEDSLCQQVKNVLKQSSLNTTCVKVCRKTKDLVHGDFVVPKGVLNIDLDSETLKDLHLETAIQDETAEDTLPILRLSQDKYNSIIFHVNRNKAFQNIIQEVCTAGDGYGYQPARDSDTVIVNPVDLNACATGCDSDLPASLTQLRAVVLMKHLLQLLIANGYQAAVAEFPTTDNLKDLLGVLHVDASTPSITDVEKVCEQLLVQAQACPWQEATSSDAGSAKENGDEENKKSVVLNLRKFLTEKGFQVGKDGYDKNLNLVNVKLGDGEVSEVIKEVAVTEWMASRTCLSQDSHTGGGARPVCFIHLVSQSLAFTQQQVDLVWTMCTPFSSPQSLKQHHHVFGTAGRRKSSASVLMDAKEFYNVRHRQMTQAAMMKYGDHDQGESWDDMVSGLTAASITFDILGTASSSQVHLDLSDDGEEESVDNRSGPFVLYNCARLATLLHSFQQQVEQGVYPSLPSPSEVDFQLLREEEEWTMALLYIHGFPRLVQETLNNWHDVKVITSRIHTHKVSHFLLNFSKILSSYYSRYHILGGSEAHLLPLMFARLSLMKVAHQVLCNGLRLLGLQPFSQL